MLYYSVYVLSVFYGSRPACPKISQLLLILVSALLALSQHHSRVPCLSITLMCHALSQHHSRVPCLVSASLSCALPCLSITLVCHALSQHHSRVPCLVSASLSCALPCLSITLGCVALSQLASRHSCSLKTPMCLACLFQLSMEAS